MVDKKIFNSNSATQKLIVLSGILGVLGGLIGSFLVLFFIPKFWNLLWGPLTSFNVDLEIIGFIQVSLLVIFFFFIFSIICIHILNRLITTENDADLVGLIIGAIVSYSLFSTYIYQLMMKNILNFPPKLDPGNLHLFIDTFSHHLPEFILVVCIFTLIQMILAKTFFRFSSTENFGSEDRIKKLLKMHPIFCLFCVFLIFISLTFFSYTAIRFGIINENPDTCCLSTIGIRVDRVNGNEISITQFAGSVPVYLDTPEYPFHIIVNGKEVSNMELIRQQELSDMINPPEGLVNHRGSRVNLTGPDFIENNETPINLIISEDFYNKPLRTWYNGTITFGGVS
jgi:hypothetical protein